MTKKGYLSILGIAPSRPPEPTPTYVEAPRKKLITIKDLGRLWIMIKFQKAMHIFSLLSGLLIYLILLILFLITAFIVYRRKRLNLFKNRLFLRILLVGLFLLPAFSWLGWRFYSQHRLHSYVKMMNSCDSIKFTIHPPSATMVIKGSSGDFCISAIKRIYSEEEINFYKKKTQLVITDKTVIKSLSDLINQAEYWMPIPFSHSITWCATEFQVFKKDKQVCSFAVLDLNNLLSGKNGWFSLFSSENLQKEIFRRIPEFRPLALRAECAANLDLLGFYLNSYTTFVQRRGYADDPIRSYPDPNYWNDLLLAYHIKASLEENFFDIFVCNNQAEGLCDYAMNPKCTPESPNDVVLLFEAETGWNQHGGSELMNFDNHQPRGCHVLFNDETVKFIRPDEADTLNWGTNVNSQTTTR